MFGFSFLFLINVFVCVYWFLNAKLTDNLRQNYIMYLIFSIISFSIQFLVSRLRNTKKFSVIFYCYHLWKAFCIWRSSLSLANLLWQTATPLYHHAHQKFQNTRTKYPTAGPNRPLAYSSRNNRRQSPRSAAPYSAYSSARTRAGTGSCSSPPCTCGGPGSNSPSRAYLSPCSYHHLCRAFWIFSIWKV